MGRGRSRRGPNGWTGWEPWDGCDAVPAYAAGMTRIEAVRGDITAQEVDAVVNAANSSLLGGGGVDGAIHAAAGPALLDECRELRRTRFPDGLPVGDAVATGAGAMRARFVIHTVGPNRHRGQTDPALLASCFSRSLAVAREVGARSVAFPAVSAGIYGWDGAEVAEVAVAAVRDDTAAGPGLDLVRFVLFSDALLAAFAQRLAQA
jgi:O-acetyl-ADP-ribose deacetylase (regulator of RNase III)